VRRRGLACKAAVPHYAARPVSTLPPTDRNDFPEGQALPAAPDAGLGLAETLADDSKRRERIVAQWATMLDAVIRR